MQEKLATKSYLSRVCYAFLGLTIAFVLVFIFWTNKRSNPEFAVPPPSTLDTKDNNTCPVWSLVGDGYCDDEANIAECGHDLNDCCQVENDRSLCQNCSCVLSSEERQVIKEKACKKEEYNYHLGDGICDHAYNKAENFFDVGDCCLTFQDHQYLTCRQEINDGLIHTQQYGFFPCFGNLCIESNNFCIPDQLGDGICQDHNNGPFCDYDLGDCCLNLSFGYKVEKHGCCSCTCHGGSIFDINQFVSG